ncbi:hypothetical protein QBC37DRAFT_417370 [Rhypophila decipiens]|uniref:Rhodopsin domain-containing protein n=1 Tax=Rhypophila decipiens TaxID=261697 RepID=A0AAN6YGN6_9PEZI|nr:hypothetical protein QBC37DRAFT_417370 [Rhypophila decipiens]
MAPQPDDPNDLNRVLQMATWLLLAVTSLMVGFRLLTRFFLRSNNLFSVEEGLAIFAYIFSLGQSVTVLVPESKIIGRDYDPFSVLALKQGLSAIFAGNLLFIVAIGLSKLTMCACLVSLSPDRLHRSMVSILGGFIVMWTISSVLASALRCGGRLPWQARPEQCVNWGGFLMYLDVSSIITDAALLVLPAIMIYPLNMPMRTRLSVLSFFGSRIFVIIPTIVRLVYLPRLFERNFTLLAFPYYLCTEIIQFAAISTNCVVYFWPLLHSLRTGLMWADNLGTRGATDTSSFQYALSNMMSGSRQDKSNGGGSMGGGFSSRISEPSTNLNTSQGSVPLVDGHNGERPVRKNYVEITKGYEVNFGRVESA